jgi:hypothetical protein
MRNWGQIVFGGGVAGFIFCGTLLITGVSSPWYFLLAVALGFLAGYLAHEFDEVRVAALAFGRFFRQECQVRWSDFRQWLKNPHPYLLISSPVWFGFWCCSLYLVITYLVQSSESVWVSIAGFIPALAIISFTAALMAILVSAIVMGFVLFGAELQNVFFIEPDAAGDSRISISPGHQKEMLDKGYIEQPFTYGNVFHWYVGGLFETFFLAAITWCGLVPVAIWTGSLLFRLLVQIHSSKRLMCGSGGVIGGWIAHVLLWNAEMSFWQAGLYLLAGALFGACVALLEWRLIQALSDQPDSAPVEA